MKILKILDDRRRLLFLVSLFVTLGGWILTLSTWSECFTPAAIGGLFILLGNNVFSNAIKNIGFFSAGVTNESDPKTTIGGVQ
jgi:xanthine/uracil permease